MDLLLSPDQASLVETVEDFLSKELSLAQLRERLRNGAPVEPAAWSGAGELGVFSLGLPASAGGTDLPIVEEALVFTSLGRQLAPVGFVAQVVAARIAEHTGDTDLRARITDGSAPVALAIGQGRVCGLPGAELVLADDGDRLSLLSTDQLTAEPLDCLDPTTHLSRVNLGEAAVRAEVQEPEAEPLRLLGTLLTAALLVGIAQATRDAGVAYAKERKQFGKLIGTYQGVKHPLADAATRCEAASSLLGFAALALRDGREDAAFQVSAAKRIATAAAYDNSRTNVQVHGGMGVTWEHDAHLFLTRTHLLDQVFGNVRAQQCRVLANAPAVP